MTDTTWYLIYISAMAAGALLFWVWSRDPKGVPKDEYWVAMVIPIWSGLMYFGMLTGQTVIEMPGRDPLYLGRYLDWIVTTPLLLWALVSTAHFRRHMQRPLLAGVIAANIMMIVAGFMGDWASQDWAKWTWFTIGVVCLLIILAITWGRLRATAYEQGDDVGRAYVKVAAFLSLAWLGYPLIWALGPSGVGALPIDTELALFVLLPIVSKVGFSIFDLYELRKLGAVKPGLMPFRGQHHTSP